MVKQAAGKTSDTAGDGTTTATGLAQAIGNDGLRPGKKKEPPSPSGALNDEYCFKSHGVQLPA